MTTSPRRWLLRQRTTGAHAALDAVIGGFDDFAGYGAYLRGIAAFRAPIERQLRHVEWPGRWGEWRPAMVTEAIAQDMADLGIDPRVDPAPPLSLDGDRLYGTLYVLEGSALGARLLLQRAEALGLSARYGARHLACLSGNIAGWRGFLDRLEEADPFDLERAVEASVATFGRASHAFEAR